MRNLAEDLDEMYTEEGKRWVRRARNNAGLLKEEGSAWEAVVEAANVGEEFMNAAYANDRHVVTLSRSPGDVMLDAASYASARMARQDGFARWTLENLGGGEGHIILKVVAVNDDAYYQQENS